MIKSVLTAQNTPEGQSWRYRNYKIKQINIQMFCLHLPTLHSFLTIRSSSWVLTSKIWLPLRILWYSSLMLWYVAEYIRFSDASTRKIKQEKRCLRLVIKDRNPQGLQWTAEKMERWSVVDFVSLVLCTRIYILDIFVGRSSSSRVCIAPLVHL